jgi:hypothetical protein
MPKAALVVDPDIGWLGEREARLLIDAAELV